MMYESFADLCEPVPAELRADGVSNAEIIRRAAENFHEKIGQRTNANPVRLFASAVVCGGAREFKRSQYAEWSLEELCR